jgi:hypothetical protein
VRVAFSRHEGFDFFSTAGAPPSELAALVRIERRPSPVFVTDLDDEGEAVNRSVARSVWAPGARGWFCAGFGPYRRFSGGKSTVSSTPSLARTLSLFDEQFALGDALDAIVEAAVDEQLGRHTVAGITDALLDEAVGKRSRFQQLKTFINQDGFLPHGVRLQRVDLAASPRRVLFVDGNGYEVPIEELSDGFRSALSLVIELLRQLTSAFGADIDEPRVVAPGVCLIDEIDAHLHPTWQHRIGDFLVRAMPNIQFIVTTHSPLVCQGTTTRSVFLLPEPGQPGEGRFLDTQELDRLRLGNVLDAYGTGAFGVGVAQSDAGKQSAARLGELNGKELLGGGLDAAERAERDALRARLPTRAAAISDETIDALARKVTAQGSG